MRQYFSLKAMLLIVILAIPFLSVKAEGISIQKSRITIKQALDEIEIQTGYTFAYSRSKFNDAKQISLSLNSATIQDAMSRILASTGFIYKISGKHVIITPNETPAPPVKKEAVYTPPKKTPPPMPVRESASEVRVREESPLPQPLKEGEPAAPEKNEPLDFSPSRLPLQPAKKYGPVVALKTNLLYDATTTFNLGLEFRLSNSLTLELPVNYNPWTFSDNKKIKHILVQPELRYWFCEAYNGHFLGFHVHYARFNAGNLNMPNAFPALLEHRFDGSLYGVGASYGYQWYLSPRWAMETTFGFGYFYADYEKFECPKCGESKGRGYKHYFGPTKVGLSVIYMLK